ncbi:synaptic vesicle 2-related protein [Acyrthosiphon pisum]|uniref:Major facilitator superfamily (MFS) profile domain-containing protein n=1 Tax=Acyrthosiphon pisum TaxID=7029 RepID=A0A8R2A430_ACYPI|nr:synaptic vesicle 2-related protein [Acyrthosiphon pisum]|eukprot:XP_001945003.1 PREDICTED: synaptic vesicle 2-related protein [Acyrthosiphon pisum]
MESCTSAYQNLNESDRRISNAFTAKRQAQDFEMSNVTVVPDETYTVAQAVDAFGFGRFQVKLSLFTGLCWMADSMETTILSILSPTLQYEWQITLFQQALATTVVFMGMMLSLPFWGSFSDKFGRKTALTLCSVLLFYFGILSSMSPNYTWLLVLRGLVGFAIGCSPQSVTLYAEFLPCKQRAKCVVLLDCFWALGACFEVLLALIVMPTLGWKWLLVLSTAPLLGFACVCPWLPESAKYLVTNGQTDKAIDTLKKVAYDNGKPMLLGRLVVDDVVLEEKRGSFTDLLLPQLRVSSILLWFIWLVCAFCYYGIVLMSTGLFESSYNNRTCSANLDSGIFKTVQSCTAESHYLTTRDYIDLLWTTLAEFPGIFATIFVIDRFGRKITLVFQFTLFAITLFLLFQYAKNRVLLTIILFLARGIIAGVFQAVYVYTPEVYPTPLRSIGVGTCSAMARLGAMVTPYVAQVLLKSSFNTSIIIYITAALLAAIASSLLPIETKGRDMKEEYMEKD